MTDEPMVSVRATDLLLVLRNVHGAVTPAERAAVARLREVAHEAAARAADDTAESEGGDRDAVG